MHQLFQEESALLKADEKMAPVVALVLVLVVALGLNDATSGLRLDLVSDDFRFRGELIPPHCLKPLSIKASGDLDSAIVFLVVPGARGCFDGNSPKAEKGDKGLVRATSLDGGTVAYRLLQSEDGLFLVRYYEREAASSFMSTVDLLLRPRSKSLLTAQKDGKIVNTFVPALELTGIAPAPADDGPSRLEDAIGAR